MWKPAIRSKFRTLSAVLIVLTSSMPGMAAPPPANDDGNKPWYLFLIKGSPKIDPFINKYQTAYTSGSTVGSILTSRCWNPGMVNKVLFPAPQTFEAVALLCEIHPESIGAVRTVYNDTVAASPGAYSMENTTTSTCPGWHCVKNDSNNCTNYTCFGQTHCYHYLMPCGIHNCVP
jgi:hypothetical protein